ncbi:MAG: flagellin FliC [Candidatus Melainabacteria bacterium]|nr:MAG: flagellin FliC [Candidatus Melainabacteria bacterium]
MVQKKARDNANIGINMLQTAEGSLTTIQDNLQRIRDLTVQAGNQVYSAESLAAMQMEVDARLAEITRIADVAEFNGLKLLSHDGSMGDVTLQVGANSNAAENTITLTDVFTDTTVTAAGLDVGSTKYEKAFTGGDTNQIANAQAYLSAIDVALETVATKRSKIGAFQNRLNSAIDTLTVNIENLSAARSTIQDTDVAVESSNYIKNQILQQSTTAMLSAANQAPQVALSLIG